MLLKRRLIIIDSIFKFRTDGWLSCMSLGTEPMTEEELKDYILYVEEVLSLTDDDRINEYFRKLVESINVKLKERGEEEEIKFKVVKGEYDNDVEKGNKEFIVTETDEVIFVELKRNRENKKEIKFDDLRTLLIDIDRYY